MKLKARDIVPGSATRKVYCRPWRLNPYPADPNLKGLIFNFLSVKC